MRLAATNAYRQNRGRFSTAELQKHQGKWVAFSSDGQCILADGESVAQVCDRLRAAGQDPQDVVLERIEVNGEEVSLGSGEFH